MSRLLILLFVLSPVMTAQAALSATVDKNPVLIGETLTLTLSNDSGGDEPDLSPLEADFQILGRQSSSQFQIINGQTSRRHDWHIRLRPRRAGELRIPALSAGAQSSDPVLISVREPEQNAGEAPEAFIEFTASTATPYLRQQVLLESRLYVRGDLMSGNFSAPSTGGAVIEQLGEQAERQELRGPHRYRVIERRYALFPEQSGPLSIDAPVFTGELATGRQRRSVFGIEPETRAIYAAAEPLRLEVQAPPATAGANWLPARDVQIQDQLDPAGGPWQAGEPITRSVSILAQGQMHTQLPAVDLPSPAGAQSYTKPPQEQTGGGAQGFTARRDYTMVMVPDGAGTLRLPELRLRWFDTGEQRWRESVLPARELNIQPAPGVAASAPPAPVPPAADQAAVKADTSPARAPVGTVSWLWQILALGALAGWLGTVLAWWLQTRPRAPESAHETAPAQTSRRATLKTLQSADAKTCRQALLTWAKEALPEARGLLNLSRFSDDPDLPEALRALDAASFGPGGEFDRAALQRLVREFRKTPAPESSSHLPPLYPG